MAAAKKRGLGRGLDALLGGDGAGTASPLEQEGELRSLPIQHIQPGKYQPRRHWNDEALDELAASIKAQGLIQPVVVRAIGSNSYELIAGERRWRAAQRAQMSEIPALVKTVDEAAVPSCPAGSAASGTSAGRSSPRSSPGAPPWPRSGSTSPCSPSARRRSG